MSTPAPPRAIVFDLDGLMFNSEELYVDVGSEILRRRGHEFTPELIDAMTGIRPRQAIAIMIESLGLSDTVDDIENESREIFGPLLDTKLATMPGLMPLLDVLENASIPKAVATSSPREFAVDLMSRFALVSRFHFLLAAEDVVRGKPDPEIYLTAARRLAVAPREMLVLEDSSIGCRAAAAAGAIVIAVPASPGQEHCFDDASLIVLSLEDPQLYQRLGLAT